jgi:HKD family nuclease
VRIASPFIKHGAVEGLLSEASLSLRILTRFNLEHFREGVSDISALRRLVELGAQVRGVQRLHAKLYLFDTDHAVITSANMTEGGLRKNHELAVHLIPSSRLYVAASFLHCHQTLDCRRTTRDPPAP